MSYKNEVSKLLVSIEELLQQFLAQQEEEGEGEEGE